MLATEACPNVTTEIFDEGSEPTEYCTAHPGRPLQTYQRSTAPALDEDGGKPDLRQLDRNDRARAKEKIHTW